LAAIDGRIDVGESTNNAPLRAPMRASIWSRVIQAAPPFVSVPEVPTK
jgi:hypothetical protein